LELEKFDVNILFNFIRVGIKEIYSFGTIVGFLDDSLFANVEVDYNIREC
jgi:hypothetical protein